MRCEAESLGCLPRLMVDGARPSAHRRGSPERRVQLTDQFSDPPTATRGDRVAPQDVHHDRMGKDPRLRDVVGSDGGIVSGGEFERSCGMSGRSEDVFDLSSSWQGVEERRTHRVTGRTGGVARRSLSRIAGLLSRLCQGWRNAAPTAWPAARAASLAAACPASRAS